MTPGALASALWSAELRTGSGAPIELAAGQVNRSQHRRLCCPVSVSSRVITVANGLFAHGHLGELAQIHPLEMAGVALAETGAVQQRLPEDLRPGGGLPAAGRSPVRGVRLPGCAAQVHCRTGAGALLDLLRGPATAIPTGSLTSELECLAQSPGSLPATRLRLSPLRLQLEGAMQGEDHSVLHDHDE